MPAEIDTSEPIPDAVLLAKRRRGRWLVFGVLLAMFLPLLFTPVGVWLYYDQQGRVLLAEQMRVIEDSGDPLTTSEIIEYYRVPAGKVDLSKEWQAAILPFGAPGFHQTFGTLPVVNGNEPPRRDEPWPDPPLLAKLEQTHAADLAALHKIAQRTGEVRFQRDFKSLIVVLDDLDESLNAHHAVRLQFQQRLRGGDLSGALECIDTELAITRSYDAEPFTNFVNLRRWRDSGAFRDLRTLLSEVRLSDEQLAELQGKIRAIDIPAALGKAVIGDRWYAYSMFYYSLTDATVGTYELTKECTRDTGGIRQAEDCAITLQHYNALVAASKLPLPQAILEFERVDQEMELLRTDTTIDRYRYFRTLELVGKHSEVAYTTGQWAAQRDGTDALIAIRRFQLRHGQMPQTLAELVPEFLPSVPIDPFDGQPLRFQQVDDEFVVYSVGPDRVDDEGQCDRKLGPDIAVSMNSELP